MRINPLLSNWGETLIFRELKQRKFVEFSQSDKRGLTSQTREDVCERPVIHLKRSDRLVHLEYSGFTSRSLWLEQTKKYSLKLKLNKMREAKLSLYSNRERVTKDNYSQCYDSGQK